MSNNPDKNFGLSLVDFDRLAEGLRRGDERLFETTFLSHFKVCLNYLKHQDKATHDQAYDASMDALLTFRQKIAEGKIKHGNLRFLLTRMARQHFYKSVKRELPSVDLGEDHINISEDPISFDTDTMAILEASWQQLGEQCKTLLRKIFFLGNTVAAIAAAEDLKPATLRKRKERCLETLRKGYIAADQ